MSDPDRTPPPGTSAASRTTTDQPARARTIAAASPFGPAPTTIARRLESLAASAPDMLWPRWWFLRALGLIFGSAFYSLVFQIHGLIGERGILPAGSYLEALARAAPGIVHVWAAPTVLWLGAGDGALTALVSVGLLAAALLALNVWPRLAVLVCTLSFLSCVAALQDFSSYQSDGMLLQAGVAAAFLAPRGIRPGLGADSPPPRASIWLLRWEWLAIYFESGLVKLMSGDVQWRTLTAMDHYYENSPLPSWIGWYAEQLPHVFHAGTVLLTFALELGAPVILFAPRRIRHIATAVVSFFQLGIIATANYAFLNYLVLTLGVFLVDDQALTTLAQRLAEAAPRGIRVATQRVRGVLHGVRAEPVHGHADAPADSAPGLLGWASLGTLIATLYVGIVSFTPQSVPPALRVPARLAAPFRVANAYGLFAVMTTAEYEIEFQGLRHDSTWVPYPFRYKPQDPSTPPGLYAPYQPRFEWNLWFASLGPWNDNPWVVTTQAHLLTNDPTVMRLFAGNPFASAPPTAVRSVLWRYWFTDRATRHRTGRWWNREFLGVFAPETRRAE